MSKMSGMRRFTPPCPPSPMATHLCFVSTSPEQPCEIVVSSWWYETPYPNLYRSLMAGVSSAAPPWLPRLVLKSSRNPSSPTSALDRCAWLWGACRCRSCRRRGHRRLVPADQTRCTHVCARAHYAADSVPLVSHRGWLGAGEKGFLILFVF